MTRLEKAIRRVVPAHLMRQDRDVVVSLHPDGTVSFREKGRRTSYDIALSAVMWMAVKARAEELRKERRGR